MPQAALREPGITSSGASSTLQRLSGKNWEPGSFTGSSAFADDDTVFVTAPYEMRLSPPLKRTPFWM